MFRICNENPFIGIFAQARNSQFQKIGMKSLPVRQARPERKPVYRQAGAQNIENLKS